MNIIISPSKTMQFDDVIENGENPRFLNRTYDILDKLKTFSKDELSKIYKLKDKNLERVYSNIHNFNQLDENIAIKAYTGMVFKGLDLDNYNKEELEFLNNNVIILSALYGLLKPDTLIKPYRLDFNCMKSLYEVWDDLSDYIEQPIINLASNEFSKMIKSGMITIGFREYRDGKYKNIATYSKQARGIILNYIIKNKITNVQDIKNFSDNNYLYNNDISDEFNIIFTR